MKNFNRLVEDTKRIAKENGIKVVITPYKRVKIYGGFCSGYFDGEVLLTAGGKDISEWNYIFIHESCHMDQMLEKISLWDRADKALIMFDDWSSGAKTLTESQELDMIRTIQDLERDCEKRTIKKILEYNIPIDVRYYSKLANIYLYSYEFMRHHKRWFSFTPCQEQLEPHVKDKIQNSHKRVPKDLYQKFEEYANIDSNKKAAR